MKEWTDTGIDIPYRTGAISGRGCSFFKREVSGFGCPISDAYTNKPLKPSG